MISLQEPPISSQGPATMSPSSALTQTSIRSVCAHCNRAGRNGGNLGSRGILLSAALCKPVNQRVRLPCPQRAALRGVSIVVGERLRRVGHHATQHENYRLPFDAYPLRVSSTSRKLASSEDILFSPELRYSLDLRSPLQFCIDASPRPLPTYHCSQ